MSPSHVDFFRKAVEKEPDNTFARYALANELHKAGESSAGLDTLDELLERTPDYVPAFQLGGRIAVESGDKERARSILTKGIPIAEAAGNSHAASEMTQLLATLG